MYYLWSKKMQGWFTTSATYSTDLTEAKSFTRDEALAFAKRHRNGFLLVRDEDIVL